MAKCECGATLKSINSHLHKTGSKHVEWLASQNGEAAEAPAPVAPLADEELLGVLRALDEPYLTEERKAQQVAKATRHVFKQRGWPNEAHTGTVRDFLVEHNCPILPDSPVPPPGDPDARPLSGIPEPVRR